MSTLDIVIRGGQVIDGTGADGFTADVGISGNRIVEIGRIAAKGAREIDADGLAVTPGFIDGHTHMDAQISWDPIGRNSCWHGVTSVVMGNCGFSVAPVRKGEQALVARNLERAEDISGAAMNAGMDWSWEGFDEYLDKVDALPKGINYSAYIGHSALRTYVMGERAFLEEASDDDLAAMKAQLNSAMDAGALGISTSRSFAHETSDDRPVASRLASRDEVTELVMAMKGRKNAVFELAHEVFMPGTEGGEDYFGWLREITVNSGCTTTFGLLGHTWKQQLADVDLTMAAGGTMVGQTHSRGVSVVSSFRSSTPFDRLEVWSEFRKLPHDAQLAGLKDAATREALVNAVKHGKYNRAIGAEAPPPDWEKFFIFDAPLPPWRTLAEVSLETGKHPAEIIIDLAIESNLTAYFMQPLTWATDADTIEVMRHPQCVMTFSDSGAHVSQIADSSIHTHLLGYFVREKGLLSLPEAIEMITSRGARAWGFDGRGVLRQGAFADVNIFDPATIAPLMPEVVHDLPTGARRLSQFSQGIVATLVNGEVFIENGEHTGALAGQLLRRMD